MDKLRYGGYIKVISDSGKLDLEVKNTVTELFEELVAYNGIEGLFVGASPIEAGKTSLISDAGSFQSGSRKYNNFYGNYLATVYFLNLSSAEKSALSSGSSVLPVYDSTMLALSSSKIVGYATMKVAASHQKEGYLLPLDGASLVNHRRHGIQFRWDAGVLSGTFNAIAVGLNVCNNDNIYNGIQLQRGLEQNNKLLGEYQAYGYFMIPGVQSADGTVVWTSANEMLLGGHTQNDNSVARYVLNLQTGEQTALDSSDNRYGLTLSRANQGLQLVFGDYLIQQQGSYYYYYNIKTKARSSLNKRSQGMFVKDNLLYISSSYNSSAKTLTFEAYNTSFSRVSASDMTITIPDILWEADRYNPIITNYGNNYILGMRSIYYNTYPPYKQAGAVVCSDLSDIANSIVDILPRVNLSCLFMYGGEPFFMDAYQETYSENAIIENYYTNSDNQDVHFSQQGLKYTTTGMFGNLFSFKTFDQDQTIPSGDGIKLQYYYTFEH